MSKENGAPGWDAVRKQASSMTRTNYFGIGDGDSAQIQFLEAEPTCIYQHMIQIEGRWQSFTCLQGSGEECPICERGNNPRFVGVFSVINHSVDDDKFKFQMFTQGIRVLKQLERLAQKPKGLNGYIFEISRTGGGVDTSYNFDTIEERKLTEADKKGGINFGSMLKPQSRAKVLGRLSGEKEEAVKEDAVEDEINF